MVPTSCIPEYSSFSGKFWHEAVPTEHETRFTHLNIFVVFTCAMDCEQIFQIAQYLPLRASVYKKALNAYHWQSVRTSIPPRNQYIRTRLTTRLLLSSIGRSFGSRSFFWPDIVKFEYDKLQHLHLHVNRLPQTTHVRPQEERPGFDAHSQLMGSIDNNPMFCSQSLTISRCNLVQ